jgi:hypothetical protein
LSLEVEETTNVFLLNRESRERGGFYYYMEGGG